MAFRRRNPIAREIQSIRLSMRSLERAVRRLVPMLRRSESAPATAAAPRRKLKLSPARRRELKLQGSYLGYMRQLTATEKNRVRDVRGKRGVRAAVALARRLAARRG
ncbi:MAG TPA: hypothetical protein VJS92_08930 [Candidatus Polarisedimenticolaceae bacterium]|nr:hypothetical protein [Candidatus Polarisedimenticolaceae bacterium]